jgi:hypothetical protein
VFWNDGINLPVYFDGTTNTTTRSAGQVQVAVATTSGASFFMPAPGSPFNFTIAAPGLVIGQDYLLAQFGSFRVTNIVAGVNITATNLSIAPGIFYAPPMDIFDTGLFVPQFPPGRMGAYGLGRVWMALADGITFVAGDIVGGSSGTVALQYRDAILNLTENQFLVGGGTFRIPVSGQTIKAMVFATTLDVSLGQGALQVFTETSVFSCNAPVDRLTWTTISNPILTQSLIGQGATGQNSTIASNGDTIFRSLVGFGSLILGRRQFSTWGNVPISREIERAIATDPEALLQYGSAVNFDNRLLATTHPHNLARGVQHDGLVVINYDPLSNLHGKAPSVWDGAWPGLNGLDILQVNVGTFNLQERCYFLASTQTRTR